MRSIIALAVAASVAACAPGYNVYEMCEVREVGAWGAVLDSNGNTVGRWDLDVTDLTA